MEVINKSGASDDPFSEADARVDVRMRVRGMMCCNSSSAQLLLFCTLDES